MPKTKQNIDKSIFFHMASMEVMQRILKWLDRLKPKQYYTGVEILVQDHDETGMDFSERLTDRSLELKKLGYKIFYIQFTSSSNGRQTANIVLREWQLATRKRASRKGHADVPQRQSPRD